MNKRIKDKENLGEKIDKIHQLDAELKEAMQAESDAIIAFTSKDEKRTIKRKNSEGKEVPVEISNKELMEEIRVTRSLNGEAGKVLKEVSPETFEKLKATALKAQEQHDYIQENFGFSFRHMGVADYLKLTEAVVTRMLDERGN